MTPATLDPVTLEALKSQAIARADDLGHRLEPFRTAKHDPLCYVSFCNACRQMVIVSLKKEGAAHLYGYALEAPCPASHANRPPGASADAR